MCILPRQKSLRSTVFPFLACALLAAGGCSKTKQAPASETPASAATAPAVAQAGGHPLKGVVISVSRERSALLVDHEEIPGVMPAMTMEFQVGAGDLAVVREGMRIRGTMVKEEENYVLRGIWPEEAGNALVVEQAQVALRHDTVSRGGGAYREVGERLPDFALYDQSGAVAQAARFRGRQIVINFIFTRCPDANMCPLSTLKMTQLQALAREAGVTNLELISITLDPEYDTPGVLREFADARSIDTRNFSFLTGPEGAIKDLLAQMGVLAFRQGPLLQHTLATTMIDDTGKIVHRIDGSQWEPADFVSRMKRPAPAAAAANP